ncbi:Aste57867_16226 [Aphanomyces stellatus]|uniref:Aste57867_16226 protein n=1 Tax=Aphanomyces stellatus TaxID=120398 RepID=A0A485L4Z8_9STRA|nr:hypothetical protein As57867_016169 [Aphanomyces stellatus]VFT93004.1 Aste57867_16226 [Aphanomyces stellatus]
MPASASTTAGYIRRPDNDVEAATGPSPSMAHTPAPPQSTSAETPFIEITMDNDVTSTPPQTSSFSSDLVLLFPLRSGGETKAPTRYSQKKFVKWILGLTPKGGVDDLKAALRTSRCFVDDTGADFVIPMQAALQHEPRVGDDDRPQRETNRRRACLEAEYVQHTGSKADTTEEAFCRLVVLTIAKRLALTCGLTVKMFKTPRGIIVTAVADEGDLKTEAERSEYCLQASNKPFGDVHTAKLAELEATMTTAGLHASKAYLLKTQCSHEAIDGVYAAHNDNSSGEETRPPPEMDPLLHSWGKNYHPKLHDALTQWGHNEAADSMTIPPPSLPPPTLWSRLLGVLVYIPQDPWTYFSVHTPYRSEARLQPFYRRYPAPPRASYINDQATTTLFRPVDRIRLTSAIVDRHLNLNALKVKGLLLDSFAMHDSATLETLKQTWALNKTLLTQPMGAIRDYFGEKIALYFCWLELYTKMLIIPSAIGIVVFILDSIVHLQGDWIKVGFAVVIVVWSTLFNELWKRKRTMYSVVWGMHDSGLAHLPRTQFEGERRMNPVDNAPQIWFKSTKWARAKIRMSLVIVAIMVLIVIVALSGLFYLKNLSTKLTSPKDKQWASIGVSALNSIQIQVLNFVYSMVAKRLNNWENHRTDIEFENHLINKVFLFQFCNSFASFFYIAYIKHYVGDNCLDDDCLGELRLQLLVLFGVQVFVSNPLEVLLPMVMQRLNRFFATKKDDDMLVKAQQSEEERQAELAPYEVDEAFQDYNEMVIQYGFVTLFVVAFPLTPAMALFNNIIEVHVDSFKLCSSYRRPFPHRASDIGSWYVVRNFFLNVMNILAMVTNIAILLFTYEPGSKLSSEKMDATTKWITFVIAEQVCIAMRVAVAALVPDEPLELAQLKGRLESIEATVFLGQDANDSVSKLTETGEPINLVILDHHSAPMPLPSRTSLKPINAGAVPQMLHSDV